MGQIVEFNWFMVVSDENKIIPEKDMYYTIKNEKRIYPIGFQIPLILKEKGCVGMIKVLKTLIDQKSTTIYFEKTSSFKTDDEVAKHYFDRYLDFKRRENELNP